VATITGASQGTILGDSTLKEAPGAILVAAVGFGLHIPQSSTGGASGAPVTKPFTLVKMPDRASPKLLRAAFLGESLKVDIQWFMTDPLISGSARKKTFTVTLENARITDIETSGSVLQDGGVSEQISLNFTKITFRDERSTPAITVCIDVLLGRLC
jgi:type VI secretion system Hcp family effector